MKIKIKKLNPNAIIPTKGSEKSAGYDLHACINKPIVISPHQTVKIGSGLAIELPDNTFGAIVARSGLATKHGIRPSNCIGICDSDYRGEYIVALHNDSNISYTINPMERIAQLIVIPYLPVEFEEINELSETKRDSGGFGHSGKF